jgi:hypothetical protein
MAPRSAKRGGLSEDAPASVPTFTTTHAHAHRERLSGPALFSARAFPVAPGAVSRRCLDPRATGPRGGKKPPHTAPQRAREQKRSARPFPCPRGRAALRHAQLAVSTVREHACAGPGPACHQRRSVPPPCTHVSVNAPTLPTAPPRSRSRSLTRPRPALRAPIAFLQSSPASSLIDSYPCPRAWVPCRPVQLQQGKNGTECTATLSKGPSSTSRTANLRSFAILLLLDSKYENEYYWFTCKQPCREIFNILLKCFF